MIRIKIRKEIDRKKYLLFAILSFVIVLAAWLIASESGAIKEIFLPKPQNVVNYYIESIKSTPNILKPSLQILIAAFSSRFI